MQNFLILSPILLVAIAVTNVLCDDRLLSSSSSSTTSRFDRFEVENLKYDLDIEQNLMSEDMFINNNDANDGLMMPIRTANGQMYVCKLPERVGSLTNEAVGGGGGEREDEGEDESNGHGDYESTSFFSMFLEHASSLPHKSKQPEKQINFALVNEHVKTQMSRLNESNLCLYKVITFSFIKSLV